MEKEIYDVSALTDLQLRKEFKRLNGKCKTNDDVKLFIEIKAELSFREHWKF